MTVKKALVGALPGTMMMLAIGFATPAPVTAGPRDGRGEGALVDLVNPLMGTDSDYTLSYSAPIRPWRSPGPTG